MVPHQFSSPPGAAPSADGVELGQTLNYYRRIRCTSQGCRAHHFAKAGAASCIDFSVLNLSLLRGSAAHLGPSLCLLRSLEVPSAPEHEGIEKLYCNISGGPRIRGFRPGFSRAHTLSKDDEEDATGTSCATLGNKTAMQVNQLLQLSYTTVIWLIVSRKGLP